MQNEDLPDVPFAFADDPEPSGDCPSASALGGAPADCSVLTGAGRQGLAEPDWADDMGVTGAWLTIDEEVFIEDVSIYA